VRVFACGIFLLTLSGCVSNLLGFKGSSSHADQTLSDLRMEVAQLKHSLHSQQVDTQIVEEKLAAINLALRNQEDSEDKITELSDHIIKAQAHLASLQRVQDVFLKDLKHLRDHINMTSSHVNNIQKDLRTQTASSQELKELKSTLGALKSSLDTQEGGTYKVRPGDTLAKIARECNISIRQLRTINDLNSDVIKAGQILKIQNETP
jgi:LysM repeat protein